ncbi:MAG TPA: hypothetical protein VFZ32_10860 [Micromonosporaceae bacterium]
MELLRLLFRYAHLIGFALLFGGFAVQYLSGTLRINSAMLWGALVQLVTGVILSAPFPADADLIYPKIGVKLLFAVLIAIMVYVPRRRDTMSRGHFLAIGALTLLNAAVAVFWR